MVHCVKSDSCKSPRSPTLRFFAGISLPVWERGKKEKRCTHRLYYYTSDLVGRSWCFIGTSPIIRGLFAGTEGLWDPIVLRRHNGWRSENTLCLHTNSVVHTKFRYVPPSWFVLIIALPGSIYRKTVDSVSLSMFEPGKVWPETLLTEPFRHLFVIRGPKLIAGHIFVHIHLMRTLRHLKRSY